MLRKTENQKFEGLHETAANGVHLRMIAELEDAVFVYWKFETNGRITTTVKEKATGKMAQLLDDNYAKAFGYANLNDMMSCNTALDDMRGIRDEMGGWQFITLEEIKAKGGEYGTDRA